MRDEDCGLCPNATRENDRHRVDAGDHDDRELVLSELHRLGSPKKRYLYKASYWS